jgi:hypothetical protein
MPIPGGTAGKYGLRYEDRWTAHCAMKVLAEEASAIHLEPPGGDAEGFEFLLEKPTGPEFHQVKRQKTGEGVWTTGALQEAGVLTAFCEALQDSSAECVFASGDATRSLHELSDRAKKSDSFQTFEQDYLRTTTWQTNFDELRRAWDEPSPAWTWDALRRVRVATIDERGLRDFVALQTELLLDGPREQAVAAIVDLVRDRVNERLGPSDLWKALEPLGYRPNPWASAPLVAAQIERVNQRFICSRRETLIGGRLIQRAAADELATALEKDRAVVVEGVAGAGKSDVLLQLCEQLEEDGTPYLVVRLDRQDATPLPQELGRALGLPGSPPAVLAAAAPERPSYLIIDQLDAISTTSGRNVAFFECVDEMLRMALANPNMRVVLACRTFDAANDARLRRLTRGEANNRLVVRVGHLTEKQVEGALSAAAVELDRIGAELKLLLKVPLHLALFLLVADEAGNELPAARTLRDLYDVFWRTKRLQARDALGREPHWTQVLDVLADYMSEQQQLHAPYELIDDWESDAEAMLSSSVLVADDRRLAFFHETFFDYVFARRHTGRQRTLRDLLGNDQYLFRRAQVRQVLAHSRDGDAAAYDRDLRYLISDPGVRFHLKDLVLAWLATVADPREAEWQLLSPILDDPADPLHDRAWRATRSSSWFRFLDAKGLLSRWLAEGGVRKAAALAILTAAEQDEPDRVAVLLRPFQSASDEWRNDIASVLMRGDVSQSRDLFELLLSLIDEGSEDFGPRFLWGIAHDLADPQPEWVCEVLGAYLRERLQAATDAGISNPFGFRSRIVPRGLYLGETIAACSKKAPQAFFEHVWPQMVRVMDRSQVPLRDDGPRCNEVWHQPHFSDAGDDLEEDLLIGAELAVRALAIEAPGDFERLVAEYDSTSHETIAYILFQGFGAAPQRYADMAVEFLLADDDRFRIGYSSDEHWASRQLIEAVSGLCSTELFMALEGRVLAYYTTWERSRDGFRSLGVAQFTLLAAMDPKRSSADGRRRLGEWQRKFNQDDVGHPVGMIGGTIGSPIPAAAAQKMSDAQWLGAIRRYATDEDRDLSRLTGGASQLASQLEQRASEDPVRFARLASKVPDETNIHYFDALLLGVGKSGDAVPLGDAVALVERCHALPGRPCGRWIDHPLRAHIESGLPAPMLEVLAWYAVEDPDPLATPPASSEESDDEIPGGRLLHRGLNSVRGGMAYVFTRIVHHDAGAIDVLEPAIRSLVNDPSMAVRAMAAETTVGLLRHHESLALELFEELVGGGSDELLATRHVREFLRYRGHMDFGRLEAVIDRMVGSAEGAVREAGAAQAALAALSESRAESLVVRCGEGDRGLRLGLAKVYGANLLHARYRARCEAALEALFDDADAAVRKTASEAISRLRDDEVLEVVPLVRRFLETRAFADQPEAALHALEFATAPPPDLALDVCEKVMQGMAGSGSVQDRDGALSHDVSEQLVRAYADARGEDTINRALDLVDEALRRDILGTYRTLQEHDRG